MLKENHDTSGNQVCLTNKVPTEVTKEARRNKKSNDTKAGKKEA